MKLVIELHPEAEPPYRYAVCLDCTPEEAAAIPLAKLSMTLLSYHDTEESARLWCESYCKRAVVAEYPL